MSSGSTPSIRITTSGATATSPVSTIILKQDANLPTTTALTSTSVGVGSVSSVQTTKEHNSGQKVSGSGFSSSTSGLVDNSEFSNDSNDNNKTNYSAMTKKRKAMHQARNSNEDNSNK